MQMGYVVLKTLCYLIQEAEMNSEMNSDFSKLVTHMTQELLCSKKRRMGTF